MGMKNTVNQAVELETAKVDFLKDMVEAYGLPDAGKAIRCLINYHVGRFQRPEVFCASCR